MRLKLVRKQREIQHTRSEKVKFSPAAPESQKQAKNEIDEGFAEEKSPPLGGEKNLGSKGGEWLGGGGGREPVGRRRRPKKIINAAARPTPTGTCPVGAFM